MEENKKEIMIDVSGLRKKYRLGKIGADTLQGAIKEWQEQKKQEKSKTEDYTFRQRIILLFPAILPKKPKLKFDTNAPARYNRDKPNRKDDPHAVRK